jgi:hypothetical protein
MCGQICRSVFRLQLVETVIEEQTDLDRTSARGSALVGKLLRCQNLAQLAGAYFIAIRIGHEVAPFAARSRNTR